MATKDEILKNKETEIRKKAEEFKVAKDASTEAGLVLKKAAEDYNTEREKFQRESFAKKELGWCHGCREAYPEKSVVLLYTDGTEKRGSHYTESFPFVRRVRSFCTDCAEEHLSSPRGRGQGKCFKTEKRGDEFFIFVSGKWISIEKPGEVIINIEKEYLSEEDYDFGKKIVCMSGPLRLKIDEEEVV